MCNKISNDKKNYGRRHVYNKKGLRLQKSVRFASIFFAKLWLETMLRICCEIFRFGISSKGLRIRSMENRKKVGRSEWSQDRRDAEDKEYRT